MVTLTWEHKRDITEEIDVLKSKHLNVFNKIQLDKQIITPKDGQQINRLYWGENIDVLYHLMNKFQSKIDLIYIDPPFFSGSNYHITVEGDGRDYNKIAYTDHWDNDLDSYLQMLYERIILFKQLLSERGLLFVHLDWHASHYIRAILDEIFGEKRFVNNIIWYYYNKYSAGKSNLPRAHDDILVYSKTSNYTFNELRIPRKKPIKQLKRTMVDGVLKNAKDKNGHVIYRIVKDKKEDDVWRIPCLQPASKEWTGFPTQKHHDLLKKIIKLGSKEGDLVADFFCGSGTTLLMAEKLNRRWIGGDCSEIAIYLTRKRLLEWQRKQLTQKKNVIPFHTFSNLDANKLSLIKDGFFEKKLAIRRKK